MRVTCPHCGVEESQCAEAFPVCAERGVARRLLYARANGDELGVLRAENEALRLENEMLRLRPAENEARLALLDARGADPLGPCGRPHGVIRHG